MTILDKLADHARERVKIAKQKLSADINRLEGLERSLNSADGCSRRASGRTSSIDSSRSNL